MDLSALPVSDPPIFPTTYELAPILRDQPTSNSDQGPGS